jgi:diacylglycerol kinase
MIKKHIASFGYAWEGLVWSFTTQPNYRIHAICSLLAVILGFILAITYTEFLIILMLIFFGFTVETVNTAIEKTLDVIDTNIRPDIKIAKDVAAAAMLLISIGSLIIAAIIFIPKLIGLL